MKKTMLLIIAVLIGTATLFATNPKTTTKTAKKEIRNQIADLLTDADFTVNREINVELTFTFSSEGEIVVLNVNSKNKDVLNYVRENINYKTIENPGIKDKIYTMPLKVMAK